MRTVWSLSPHEKTNCAHGEMATAATLTGWHMMAALP